MWLSVTHLAVLLHVLFPALRGTEIFQHDSRVKRQSGSDKSRYIVCYYPNWSQYRAAPAAFTVDDIDPNLCTHLAFAFAKITNDNKLAAYEWNDNASYQKFQDLKKKNVNLKTLLSVGGHTLGTEPFIRVSSTPQTRKQFTANCIAYLRQHGFDGLDVDWEFPTGADKNIFTLLLQELSTAFVQEADDTDKSRLLLTSALGPGKNTIEQAYDMPAISVALDFANVMTYDLHGSWDNVLGIHAAVNGTYPGDPLCVDWIVNRYLSLGFPAQKMVLGIPTYGRSFTLCDASETSVRNRSCGAGQEGTYTQSVGTLAYYEICPHLGTDWSRTFSDMQKTPFAFSDPPSTGGTWVGYDDVQSVTIKAEMVKSRNLLGVMFWDLSTDDFSGQCGAGDFTLVNAAKSALQGDPAVTQPTITPSLTYRRTRRVPVRTRPPNTLSANICCVQAVSAWALALAVTFTSRMSS